MSEIDTAEIRERARREIARTHSNHELAGYALAAADEIDRLRAQLPDGMKDCTIQFKQCKLGHGWLTATNWVQHGCLHCAALEDAASEIEDFAPQWAERIRALISAGVEKGNQG